MNPTLVRRRLVRSPSDIPVNRVSPTKISPRVTESSPASVCINVDLPDPDGPMIAVNCPRSSSTLTPCSAMTWASPLPYTFHTSTARAATACPVVTVVVTLDPPLVS